MYVLYCTLPYGRSTLVAPKIRYVTILNASAELVRRLTTYVTPCRLLCHSLPNYSAKLVL